MDSYLDSKGFRRMVGILYALICSAVFLIYWPEGTWAALTAGLVCAMGLPLVCVIVTLVWAIVLVPMMKILMSWESRHSESEQEAVRGRADGEILKKENT